MPADATPPPSASVSSAPRTRRALLAGAAGSLVALVATRLAGPEPIAAAAGDPLILGNTGNTAGTLNTTLATTSSGTALHVVQNGTGTALRGSAVGPSSIAGFFTATNGTGVSGVSGSILSYGVYGANDAASFGSGAAGVRAAGGQNHGLVATTSGSQADGVRASHAGTGTAVRATAASGVAVQAVGQAGVAAEATGSAASGVSGLATGTGASVGVRGESSSDAGRGVHGIADSASGAVVGVLGESVSASGIGVKGLATRVNGSTTGVHGEASSPSGVGVRAVAPSLTGSTEGLHAEVASPGGLAVKAVSTAVTGNTAAVAALTASTGGIGVFADATAATGNTYGVVGSTHSTTELAAGVWGSSIAATGKAVGVYGQTNGTEQTVGVLGWAWASTGTGVGVNGITSSPNGIGVLGLAGPSPSIGVYGSATGNGFGLFSQGNARVAGNLDVTGTINGAASSSRIDHPLDPANQFLSHSAVESPDMKTMHDGVAKLDGKGEATIALPDWFESLNGDLRYQLTPIGEPAPVFVRSKVKSGRFTIAGGAAGQEVSWQVTGIRRDVWAEAHRTPVEERKTGALKGRYLHPEEHGQPASKGIKVPTVPRSELPKAPKRPMDPA